MEIVERLRMMKEAASGSGLPEGQAVLIQRIEESIQIIIKALLEYG